MRELIISALKEYKRYVSAANMLKQYVDRYPDPERQRRLDLLEAKRIIIESWLGLLSDDELYVIHRHLIDGLSWSKLEEEFARLRGQERAKSERMLKLNQKTAIMKMAAFTEEYGSLVEELFLSEDESVQDSITDD